MKSQLVRIEGTPAGGETVAITVNGRVFGHVARKRESATSIAQQLAEQINTGSRGGGAKISAGPTGDAGGIAITSMVGWDVAISATCDDPSLKVSVMPQP